VAFVPFVVPAFFGESRLTNLDRLEGALLDTIHAPYASAIDRLGIRHLSRHDDRAVRADVGADAAAGTVPLDQSPLPVDGHGFFPCFGSSPCVAASCFNPDRTPQASTASKIGKQT
jgi:hypothetical protein